MAVKIEDISNLLNEIENLDRDIYRAKCSYTEWDAALKDESLSLYEVDFMHDGKRHDVSIRGGNSSHDIALKIMQYLVDDTASQIDVCARRLNEKLEKLEEYKKLFPELDLSWKTEAEKEKERQQRRAKKSEEEDDYDPCEIFEKDEDSCFNESCSY